jgi:hypothetical protein
LTLAQEAARAGHFGKGFAVVAHEARIIADKLFEYTEKVKFDGVDDAIFKGIVESAIQMKFLSVNAVLEIDRMVEISMDFNIPKSMAVFAEELRRIAIGLDELTDNSVRQKPFTMPELASPVESSSASEGFFLYSICGNPLIENMKNIQEVCYCRKSDIEGNTLSLRGLKIPVINCSRYLNLSCTDFDEDRQTVMIINPEGVSIGGKDGIYAVPIDELDINLIFYSRVGYAVSPKKGHAFSEYSRECWDVVGGDQVVFADWKKLIKTHI